MSNYQIIKQLAKENGVKPSELLALSAVNDPFYAGSPTSLQDAQWFAEIWNKYGFPHGTHLRRVHYNLVARQNVELPKTITYKDADGVQHSTNVYVNEGNVWHFLACASKYARYLGLVEVGAFVDKRNPEPHIFSNSEMNSNPSYQIFEDDKEIYLPEIPRLMDLPDMPDLPELLATGYDNNRQGYLVEVWAEKSTMDDILLPVCERYGVNLVTGLGELSITAVYQFLRRVSDDGRPARILYVSDYDPAGIGMPISVARKIEYYVRATDEYSSLDISLNPVVLTADQIDEYNLETATGHRDGQVELDALEGAHPGVLAEILEQEILRYYDEDLQEKTEDAESAFDDELEELSHGINSNDYDELSEEYEKLKEEYAVTQQEFEEVMKKFAPKIEAYRERLEDISERGRTIREWFKRMLDQVYVEIEPLPSPEVEGDPDDMLYESGRDYMEQLEAYKARREE